MKERLLGYSEWLAIGLFVVGIPVTWLLARRNRQKPDVRYAIDQEELIAPEDSLLDGGLELKFRGSALTRLTRTYVAVWSKRGDTVRREDLTAADPLRIELEPSDAVLSARVVTMSRSQIQVAVSVPQANIAELSFDFLDPKDGFIVELLHRTNAEAELHGTLKGCDLHAVKGADLDTRSRERAKLSLLARIRDKYRGPGMFVFAVGIVLLASVILMLLAEYLSWDVRALLGLDPREVPEQERTMMRILYTATLVPLLFLMPYTLLSSLRRKIPRSILTIDQQSKFDWSPGLQHENFPSSGISVGDTIQHNDFGRGTVERIMGEGRKSVIVVNFADHGPKKLLAAIAPIMPPH
jgi:hypothetical protein